MAEPLRVVIADDNYLVREGTRRLLEESGQVTVQVAVQGAGAAMPMHMPMHGNGMPGTKP